MIINMKKIGILGSTGSIGTKTLDIVRKEKETQSHSGYFSKFKFYI